MGQNASRKLKIINAHYTWHPDFEIDEQGKPVVLKTGKWVVEWVLKELNNTILEHYTATRSTEKEAQELLQTINDIGNEFLRYRSFRPDDKIYKLGTLTAEIDCVKKRTILKDRRCE